MDTPKFITTPFAEDGSRNEIPENGTDQDVLASMQLGFPPLTFQPIGGTPPDGRDVNAILHTLCLNVQFMQAGSGQWPFDADFAQAIGGYKKGQRVLHANKTDQWLCVQDNNTNNPDTGGAGWQLLLATQTERSLAGLIALWTRPEDTVPANALVCKGQSINSTQYPKLYTAWYGAYSPNQTFRLPDFSNGYYPKGWGASTQAIGTRQTCALPNIWGDFSGRNFGHDASIVANGAFTGENSGQQGADGKHGGILFHFNASRCSDVYGRRNTGTVETNNVATLFIVYTE